MRLWLVLGFFLLSTNVYADLQVKVIGVDDDKSLKEVQVKKKNGDVGLKVFTAELGDFEPIFKPFINATFGNDLTQNIGFSGDPQTIDNGGDGTGFAPSIIQGTWNFADAGKTSLTDGNDSDEALFASASSISWENFTAVTGKIRLNAYNNVNNNINLDFALAGVQVGDTVVLDGFIDTTDLTNEQNFVIPKIAFNVTTESIDEFTISLARAGGAKPTFRFDDIQMEQTGDPAIFVVAPDSGTKFFVDELRFAIADNVTGIVTVAGATENATIQGLSFDAILGVSVLSNGLIFQRIDSGEIIFTVVIKQLGDLLATGGNIENVISDGTNTFMTILVVFPTPIVLDSRSLDRLLFTLSDDFSSFLQFTIAARGKEEIIK